MDEQKIFDVILEAERGSCVPMSAGTRNAIVAAIKAAVRPIEKRVGETLGRHEAEIDRLKVRLEALEKKFEATEDQHGEKEPEYCCTWYRLWGHILVDRIGTAFRNYCPNCGAKLR